MSLVFFDGFDNVTNSTNLGYKGWSPTGSAASVSALTRYSVGNALNLNGSSISFEHRLTMPTAITEIIIGFAMFRISDGGSVNNLIRLTSTANVEILNIRPTGVTGTVGFNLTGPGGTYTVISTTPTTICETNFWDYWEFRIKISATVGEFEVRRNGTQVHLGTGLNTGAVAIGNLFLLNFNTSNGNTRVDDFYVVNNVDSQGFLGEVRSHFITVSEDTNQKEWEQSNVSVPSYTLLSELASDGDTSYISSRASGATDLYEVGSLPLQPVLIAGVRPLIQARAVLGPVNLVSILKAENGNTNEFTTSNIPSTFGAGLQHGAGFGILQNNPITTAPWTFEDLNTMKVGVRLEIP